MESDYKRSCRCRPETVGIFNHVVFSAAYIYFDIIGFGCVDAEYGAAVGQYTWIPGFRNGGYGDRTDRVLSG